MKGRRTLTEFEFEGLMQKDAHPLGQPVSARLWPAGAAMAAARHGTHPLMPRSSTSPAPALKPRLRHRSTYRASSQAVTAASRCGDSRTEGAATAAAAGGAACCWARRAPLRVVAAGKAGAATAAVAPGASDVAADASISRRAASFANSATSPGAARCLAARACTLRKHRF